MTTNQDTRNNESAALTGRVAAGPRAVLRDLVLVPQFEQDVEELLPHYVSVERALVDEYLRMGVVSPEEAEALTDALASITSGRIRAKRDSSMTDVAFAVERHVEERLGTPVPAWHVDRSRNDYQACGQLLFARRRMCDMATEIIRLWRSVHRFAGQHLHHVMPGYTHLQAAQVISPGFYFCAIGEQLQHSLRRLLHTYDAMDACPLGAGAMAGQYLPWDRERLARSLGFGRVRISALASVADRGWAIEVTAEFEILAVALSRFVTDLMAWGSTAYGFLDLPDDLSGISSAMPQKKNFPVLERIRGRLAHLSTYHLDTVLAQRNTAFGNSVEVSKEGTSVLSQAFRALEGVLHLFTEVVDHVQLDPPRMAQACEQEFLGGFALANRLTLNEGVPWRRAQVVAGQFIVAAMATGAAPTRLDPRLLGEVAARSGIELSDPAATLADVFDPGRCLLSLQAGGSAHPQAVAEALEEQLDQARLLDEQWATRAGSGR
jgi:argininosuccinate lyase